MGVSAEPDLTADMLGIFQRQGLRVAERLRATADDVERHALRENRDLRDLLPDVIGSAQEIVHDITSMFPNLHLDALLSAAKDADRYVREAR